jgi:hypothetical protein
MTVASNADKLVADYLKTLDRELRGISRTRREELTAEIGEHIAEARAGLEPDDEAGVREILDRLGDPVDIAVAERPARPSSRAGWKEVVALILLPIGGIIVPIFGWVAGAVLLWASDAWSTKDKLLGTFLFPGGLLIPTALLFLVGESSNCGTVVNPQLQPQHGTPSCPPGDGTGIWEILVMGVLVLVPLFVIAYLARRLLDRPTAAVA